MKIIPLINEFTNIFNENFTKNLNPLNLERKIRDVGDIFILKFYESFLNYIDDKFKNSKERKSIYNIKETRKRTLITSVGYITINSTSYINKITKEMIWTTFPGQNRNVVHIILIVLILTIYHQALYKFLFYT